LAEAPAAPPAAASDPRHLCDVERRHVEDVLRQVKGNKVQAAKALGISRRALYRLIAKYRLEGPRGAGEEAAG
jgi:two-component system response regulator AtoC